MDKQLKIVYWNANGLVQRSQEVRTFLTEKDIDVMLVSETHFTKKSHLKIYGYHIYNTPHPGGKAHGGTAVIIKNNIKSYEIPNDGYEEIQSTNVVIEELRRNLTLSAVYCPPKFVIKEQQFSDFFHSLGNRFIAAGDYNAKHPWWGSRSQIPSPRGRQLYNSIINENLGIIASGDPTYWPADLNKLPDLIDFGVSKNIDSSKISTVTCLDLTSDHSPVIVTISTTLAEQQTKPFLGNKKTNWELFRQILDEQLSCQISLKTPSQLEQAISLFNKEVQEAVWTTTPNFVGKQQKRYLSNKLLIKLKQKRKLRKIWQTTRDPNDKVEYNKITKVVRNLIIEDNNAAFNKYIESLDTNEASNYSLWKASKGIKRPSAANPPLKTKNGSWARSDKEKATAFAEHLEEVFQPHPGEHESDSQYVEEGRPHEHHAGIRSIVVHEVRNIISNLKCKKSPGFDLINGKVIKELPKKAILLITILFNASLRLKYFSSQWKVAQVILIPKPGKPTEQITSYRPISLLPIFSKIFEKLILKRLKPILEEKQVIPDHQFGFRNKHATIEQVHRIRNKIDFALQNKKYCTAAFLDVSQAFDKVWHAGLFVKLKKHLPVDLFLLLQSYLKDRFFLVKYKDVYTDLRPIRAGVPQGSVLGPILYLIYTSDLPTDETVEIATFADDTAILATDKDPKIAAHKLQTSLNKLQPWLKKWRIKTNETKSTHVTFTLRRGACPAVHLNKQEIPQADSVKYLGMHLDKRLTWGKHIKLKRKQLTIKLKSLYWLLHKKSKLSTENKILIYKATLKPIWTYGIQLWGTTSISNINILERFQSKVLRQIVNAPWYVTNELIRKDLQVPSILEEIGNYSKKYLHRINNHPNKLAKELEQRPLTRLRLKRSHPLDLQTRFT